MTLDCYWHMPNGEKHPVFDPPLKLDGGPTKVLKLYGSKTNHLGHILPDQDSFREVARRDRPVSQHGAESFRGVYYAPFIQEVTGISLYCDDLGLVKLTNKDTGEVKLENVRVKEIARKLGNDYMVKWGLGHYPHLEGDFPDLLRMFQTYGKAGAWLEVVW